MTNSNSDASPTYRGFRRQLLYTLYRALKATNDSGIILQPEGHEDLAILDADHNIIEVIQVKALSQDLVLSDLNPGKRDSFFPRIAKIMEAFPGLNVKVITYSNIGPEIAEAFGTIGSKQKALAEKISGHGHVSVETAQAILARTHAEHVDEQELTEAIMEMLRLHPTGGNVDAAFGVLMHWLYRCAENKTKLTHADVIERLQETGRFLAESHAFQAEWFATVSPITDEEIADEQRSNLAETFYQGTSARYDHILAGLDIVRQEKLAEIARKFHNANVVIVHGASGQGKSTLAYRYLHDFYPSGFRFEVRSLSGVEHAERAALALAAHAEAIGIPIGVYVDVTVTSVGWQALIKRLSLIPNVQLLVTIREEEWRRATMSDYEFPFETIELALAKDEAESIYGALVDRQPSKSFVSFSDVWTKFGGDGPLLEFVYLVTQGDSLRSMLQQQVTHLRDQVRRGELAPEELDLLRLVSVASAFEARLNIRAVVNHLTLRDADRTLELFEKEYHLIASDTMLVGGLHPIRSRILVDALTNTPTVTWGETAATCLRLLHENDMESFLMYACSRRRAELSPLLFTLDTFNPRTWLGVLGVLRSLLWLGVVEYLDENSLLMNEVREANYDRWWLILDLDLVNAMPDGVPKFWEMLSHMVPAHERQRLEEFRSRQTDKGHVLRRAQAWAGTRTSRVEAPTSTTEWLALGESQFWIGLLKVESVLVRSISDLPLEEAIILLPINVLGDVIAGIHTSAPDVVAKLNYIALRDRFRHETTTVALQGDGETISAHFIINPFSPSSNAEEDGGATRRKNFIADEGMRRIWLMRRLFPNRQKYCTFGYGHMLASASLDFDETHRAIDRSNLPLRWQPWLNALFIELGTKPIRTGDWPTFAGAVLDIRQKTLQLLKQLEHGLEAHFGHEASVKILGDFVETKKWDECKAMFGNAPLLPKCAFDEWGIARLSAKDRSDSSGKSAQGVQAAQNASLAMIEYRAFHTGYNSISSHLNTFFAQSIHTITINSILGKAQRSAEQEQKLDKFFEEHELRKDFAHLSAFNLGEVLKTLRQFQINYRTLLHHYVAPSTLDSLEHDERSLYRRVWCLWYHFAFNHTRIVTDAGTRFLEELTAITSHVKRTLDDALKHFNTPGATATIASDTLLWENLPAVWVRFDVHDVAERNAACIEIIKATHAAIRTVAPSQLRRYAFEFYWQNLIIVPSVQGRSLDGRAWCIPMYSLESDAEELGMGWWNGIRKKIPDASMDALKLSTWNYPRLDLGANLVDNVETLVLYVEHLADLKRLPDDDNGDPSVLNQYIGTLSAAISPIAQSALDDLVALQQYITDRVGVEAIVAGRRHLVPILQGLLPLQEAILTPSYRDEHLRLDADGIEKWAESLRQARTLAQEINVHWIGDVLQESNATMQSQSEATGSHSD